MGRKCGRGEGIRCGVAMREVRQFGLQPGRDFVRTAPRQSPFSTTSQHPLRRLPFAAYRRLTYASALAIITSTSSRLPPRPPTGGRCLHHCSSQHPPPLTRMNGAKRAALRLNPTKGAAQTTKKITVLIGSVRPKTGIAPTAPRPKTLASSRQSAHQPGQQPRPSLPATPIFSIKQRPIRASARPPRPTRPHGQREAVSLNARSK